MQLKIIRIFFYRINRITSWHFSSTTLMTVEHNRGLLCSTVVLTSWNRVLEKLSGSWLVKKFAAFYGTRMFITAFTRARHLSFSFDGNKYSNTEISKLFLLISL